MGIFSDVFASGEITDIENPALWLTTAMGGRRTQSGETVTPQSAMALPAYYACIRNISEDCGKLPVEIRQKRGAGRGSDPRHGHPAQELVDGDANPESSAQSVRECLLSWALGWGNGWAEIARDGLGRPLALWPVHPSRSRLLRIDGALYLEVQQDDGLGGSIVGPRVHIPYADVLHIKGLGDGLIGFSVAQVAAEAIGVGLAAQMFAASFFGNGAFPGGLISFPQTSAQPNEETVKKIKGQWKSMYGGRNKGEPGVLLDGAQWTPMSVPPKDAQFIEGRAYQRTEIASLFRMPPHLIQDLERSTYSNIEAQGIDYTTYCLMTWLVRVEKEIARRLFTREERAGGFYAKHVLQAMLRGDYMSRTTGYRTLVSSAVMTPNEVRDLEDMNPRDDEGADALWIQGAMMPIGRLAAEPEPEPPALAGAMPSGAQPSPEPMPEPAQAPEEETPGARADAMRPVILDACARMFRKEAMACDRAAKRLKAGSREYDAWHAGFWRDHSRDIAESVAPALAVLGAEVTLAPLLARAQDASASRRGAAFDCDAESAKFADAVIDEVKEIV